MPPALLDFERKRFCEKLMQMTGSATKAHIERMIAVVEKDVEKHISDALADENLLPAKFRDSALKAEHLTIGQTMNPENLAVVIYDALTMSADPWEIVRLRGWESGSPTPDQMLELQMQAEEIALDLQKMIDHPKPYLEALEKIKQSGLRASLDETVNAWIHPLLNNSLDDHILAQLSPPSVEKNEAIFEPLRAKLTPELVALVEKYGESEIEEILVERLTAMATKRRPTDGFKECAAADELNSISTELHALREKLG
jgi:hypothetical protein